jgi:chemotaxis protein methyltransferase CheR
MKPEYQELRMILNYLDNQRGFDFYGYHAAMLKRRIQKRLFATHCQNFHDYFEFIKNNPNELDQLIDVLTINVSRFFRNSLTFEHIQKMVIPNLNFTKTKENDSSLRIWSAGCSNGEEAYSMAIILKEYLDKESSSVKPNIFATDIDKNALKQALKGTYYSKSIGNAKHSLLEKYFSKNGDQYCISDEIKKMIQFSFYDMLDKNSTAPPESIFGNFDMVLCRNVLIYFNWEYQEIIFNKIYNSLKTNGYLILGEAEVPTKNFKNKFKRANQCCKIYRRI